MQTEVCRSNASECWPDLRCFQHCSRHANIVCCTVPSVCPMCGCETSSTAMRIPPYLLPSPFVSSAQSPCSIVLRPTQGDFIRNFTHTANLHIGVTDSKGGSHDFDEDGLHQGTVWPQCLAVTVVPLSGNTTAITKADWDYQLNRFANPAVWNSHRYDDSHCNCFDFVLQFLHLVGLRQALGITGKLNKQSFCDEFLQQRTMQAARYVSLYRTVLTQGCVVDFIKASG